MVKINVSLGQNIELNNSTILSPIMKTYDIEAREFIRKQFNSISNWNDAWRELLYCILAGTQISTDIVKKAFFELIRDNGILQFLKIVESPKYFEENISKKLRKSGYRFYNTKTKVIINAAKYYKNMVEKHDYEKLNTDYIELRQDIIKNVNGIGNKISAHWLRNIGVNVPIIDIHVRRVLSCAHLVDNFYTKNQLSTREYKYLESTVVELSRKLNRNASEVDYILWKYGREFCNRNNCFNCLLSV